MNVLTPPSDVLELPVRNATATKAATSSFHQNSKNSSRNFNQLNVAGVSMIPKEKIIALVTLHSRFSESKSNSVQPYQECGVMQVSGRQYLTEAFDPQSLLVKIVIAVFIIGLCTGWKLRSRFNREQHVSSVVKRCDKQVQSQTTYTSLRGASPPRFQPLAEQSHG